MKAFFIGFTAIVNVKSYKIVKYSYSLLVHYLSVFGSWWCGLCYAIQSIMDIGYKNLLGASIFSNIFKEPIIPNKEIAIFFEPLTKST